MLNKMLKLALATVLAFKCPRKDTFFFRIFFLF